MTVRAVLATALVGLKAAALAWLLIHTDNIVQWGIWLNAVYFGLYVFSAASVYRLMFADRSR
jgi:hypothetical protein